MDRNSTKPTWPNPSLGPLPLVVGSSRLTPVADASLKDISAFNVTQSDDPDSVFTTTGFPAAVRFYNSAVVSPTGYTRRAFAHFSTPLRNFSVIVIWTHTRINSYRDNYFTPYPAFPPDGDNRTIQNYTTLMTNDWNPATLTWNTQPARAGRTFSSILDINNCEYDTSGPADTPIDDADTAIIITPEPDTDYYGIMLEIDRVTDVFRANTGITGGIIVY